MTQARVYLFTLAECHHHVHDKKLERVLRQSIEGAICSVCDSDMRCIVCHGPLKGAVAYISLLLTQGPLLPEGIFFMPRYGGVCLDCAIAADRSELAQKVSWDAHLNFGEVAGSA